MLSKKIFFILHDKNQTSNYLNNIIQILIIISLIILFISTFSIARPLLITLTIINGIILIIFIIEYILRVYSAIHLYPNKSKLKARLTYMKTPYAIIDLIAILPIFALWFNNLELLRITRIFRLFKLFKNSEYNKPFKIITTTIKNSKRPLIISALVSLIMIFISGFIMYAIENEAQPQKFGNGFDGLWWAMETLTTVGYGDVAPVTYLGKVVTTFIALLGIGIIAIPTGIMASEFIKILNNQNKAFVPLNFFATEQTTINNINYNLYKLVINNQHNLDDVITAFKHNYFNANTILEIYTVSEASALNKYLTITLHKIIDKQ